MSHCNYGAQRRKLTPPHVRSTYHYWRCLAPLRAVRPPLIGCSRCREWNFLALGASRNVLSGHSQSKCPGLRGLFFTRSPGPRPHSPVVVKTANRFAFSKSVLQSRYVLDGVYLPAAGTTGLSNHVPCLRHSVNHQSDLYSSTIHARQRCYFFAPRKSYRYRGDFSSLRSSR